MNLTFEAQKAADIAHHKQRVKWLSTESPKFDDGESVGGFLRVTMLNQSREIVGNPSLGWNTCQCEPRCK